MKKQQSKKKIPINTKEINAAPSASKDTESPKKEDRLVYIAEFKDKESGEKAIKELSNLRNTKVLYTYDRIFNGSAIETTKILWTKLN